MIHRFLKFLSEEDCRYWIDRAPKYNDQISYAGDEGWKSRTVDISDERITYRVKRFLEDQFDARLTLVQAQIQLWFEGSSSELHVHDERGRDGTDYNSLIYLNDDFEGGEFITREQSITPVPGLLTFFDGSKVYHGVNPVRGGHRYTLIFWWRDTVFL